jgi:hypothetical protein
MSSVWKRHVEKDDDVEVTLRGNVEYWPDKPGICLSRPYPPIDSTSVIVIPDHFITSVVKVTRPVTLDPGDIIGHDEGDIVFLTDKGYVDSAGNSFVYGENTVAPGPQWFVDHGYKALGVLRDV